LELGGAIKRLGFVGTPILIGAATSTKVTTPSIDLEEEPIEGIN
jgi:hypothetical protein